MGVQQEDPHTILGLLLLLQDRGGQARTEETTGDIIEDGDIDQERGYKIATPSSSFPLLLLLPLLLLFNPEEALI